MNQNMWRRMAAMLLAVLMMATGLAAAEGTEPAVVADLTAEEASEPVLLASVNGEEIWSNNADMQELMDYYISYYSSYGYDASSPDIQAYLKAAGLQWAIEGVLYAQKAAELNVTELTEEQQADLETKARAEWEEAVGYYAESQGSLTEDSTEEEKAAARLKALAYIESNFGYTEESYVREYVEGSREPQMRTNVQKAVLGEIEVTEEEITDHFNELVEEDKKTYGDNIPMYEYYTQYMGSESYYIPEGYRGITHILLEVDPTLMENYTTLAARLEEQNQAAAVEETDESTETAGNAAEAATEAAENTEAAATEAPADTDTATEAPAEPEATAEPVTQDMVDAARQAILDSVQAQVDEIMAKYKAGTPFADLIAEYGTDPGMTTEPSKTDGYAVHSESILWDPAFTQGAMALERIGDVSAPILGSYGIHLLHYTRDIPGGAVELTEAIREQLKAELLQEKENEAVTAMMTEWVKAAEIIYTNEGQAILDAAEAAYAAEESVEATEATEEVLEAEP